jgi:hypothetical protein
MTTHRTLPVIVGGTLLLTLGPALHADAKGGLNSPVARAALSSAAAKVVLTPRAGLAIWVGKPAPRVVPAPAPREAAVVSPPWRHRFNRIEPPRVEHAAPIRVPRPATARIVVESPTVVEVSSITVWVTNSNGSRISVTLTRQGGYYIGPRGEYYDGLPTNEQLRIVYGF